MLLREGEKPVKLDRAHTQGSYERKTELTLLTRRGLTNDALYVCEREREREMLTVSRQANSKL